MTRFESAPWPTLDQVTAHYLEAHPDLRDRWLLVQTLATAAPRTARSEVERIPTPARAG